MDGASLSGIGARGPGVPRRGALGWLVAGLGLFGAVLTCWVFRGLRHDDAYISFQYARHLADGTGLVFNPGERVMGFSSPLHVLLLAPLSALAGPQLLPFAAVALGSAAVIAQGLLLAHLLWRASPVVGCAVGLLVAAGLTSAHSWLALETNLFASLVLGTVALLERPRPVGRGVLLGLAFLCRYDAALLVLPVLWLSARRSRAELVRTGLAAFAVVAPWLVVSTLYFGSFLPNTFFAKVHHTGGGEYLAHYLGLFRSEPWRSLPAPVARVLALVTPALWLAGLAFVALHARALRLFVGFAVADLLAYAAIGAPSIQHWHMYVPDLAAAVLAVLGALGWWPWLARGRGGTIACGLCAAALTIAIAVGELGFARSLPDQLWLGRRDRDYRELAAWVSAHVRDGAVFLAPEVGTLGFLTGARMIDPYGLIGETNDYARTQSLASYVALMEERQPDLVLVNAPDIGRRIEAHTPYRMVRAFPWGAPWSTLLVRGPEVLRVPAEFGALRSALPSPQ